MAYVKQLNGKAVPSTDTNDLKIPEGIYIAAVCFMDEIILVVPWINGYQKYKMKKIKYILKLLSCFQVNIFTWVEMNVLKIIGIKILKFKRCELSKA